MKKFEPYFYLVEKLFYFIISIGIFLLICKIFVINYIHLIEELIKFNLSVEGAERLLNEFLLGLIFVEIFYTVHVIFTSETKMTCVGPFLFVGILATVRELLLELLKFSHPHIEIKEALLKTALLGGLLTLFVALLIMWRKHVTTYK